VLKRAADDFPELQNKQHERAAASIWSSAWVISIATLALQVLFDAVFHASSPSQPIPPSDLLSMFATSAAVPLFDVLDATAKIFGRGGRVFNSFLNSQVVFEGDSELEDDISAIWGRPGTEQKWLNGLAGAQPLVEGKRVRISHAALPVVRVNWIFYDHFFSFQDSVLQLSLVLLLFPRPPNYKLRALPRLLRAIKCSPTPMDWALVLTSVDCRVRR
jgi:hypothetical protein